MSTDTTIYLAYQAQQLAASSTCSTMQVSWDHETGVTLAVIFACTVCAYVIFAAFCEICKSGTSKQD